VRNSIRTVGTVFTAAAIALSVAPAAGAATISATEHAAVVSTVAAQAPAYPPCWNRWFRINHPYQCGEYDGYYGGGYYPQRGYYGGHRHFRRF
jgi:hypothetical protein